MFFLTLDVDICVEELEASLEITRVYHLLQMRNINFDLFNELEKV